MPISPPQHPIKPRKPQYIYSNIPTNPYTTKKIAATTPTPPSRQAILLKLSCIDDKKWLFLSSINDKIANYLVSELTPRGKSYTMQEYDYVSHYSGITNDPDIGYAGIPRFSTVIFRGLGHSFSFLCCIFAKTTNL